MAKVPESSWRIGADEDAPDEPGMAPTAAPPPMHYPDSAPLARSGGRLPLIFVLIAIVIVALIVGFFAFRP